MADEAQPTPTPTPTPGPSPITLGHLEAALIAFGGTFFSYLIVGWSLVPSVGEIVRAAELGGLAFFLALGYKVGFPVLKGLLPTATKP